MWKGRFHSINPSPIFHTMPARDAQQRGVTRATIIGFDPGTVVTGFGVVTAGSRPELLEAGAIRPKRGEEIEKRLHTIYTRAVELIRSYKPEVVAVEDPFIGKNPQSALVLGQARGVLLLAAAEAGLPVAHYSPRAVKASIVGRGSASKEQVQFMVMQLLGLKSMPEPLDASDAIAVAMCHHHRGVLGAMVELSEPDVTRLAKNPADAEAIARWKRGGRRRG